MSHDICKALNLVVDAFEVGSPVLDPFFESQIEEIDLVPRLAKGPGIPKRQESGGADHRNDNEAPNYREGTQ